MTNNLIFKSLVDGASPFISFENNEISDIEGSRNSFIEFKGCKQNGNELKVHQQSVIESIHSGGGNKSGKLLFKVNDGDDADSNLHTILTLGPANQQSIGTSDILTTNFISKNVQNGGSATTIKLSDDEAVNDEYYINYSIEVTNGVDDTTQIRTITNYVATTKIATVNTAWDNLPDDNTFTYTIILPLNVIKLNSEDLSNSDDFYKNSTIEVTKDGVTTQRRQIISYDSSSKYAFVDTNWDNQPIDNTYSYSIVSSEVTINGNLTVNSVNSSSNTTTKDTLIKLANGTIDVPNKDLGFIFTRGDGSNTNEANKGFIWDESATEFSLIKCNNEDGTTHGNVSIEDYENLKLKNLAATNNATVGGSLGVTNNATVGGTLGVTGTLTAPKGSIIGTENNVGLGTNSLFSLNTPTDTNGIHNTCVGYKSGYSVTTGKQNTCIGGNSNTSSVGAVNQTSIGYGAVCNDNNEISLGNDQVETLRCAQQAIASLSDIRDKTNISDSTYGLTFIDSLRPVQFTWDKRNLNPGDKTSTYNGKTRLGFIAQELEDAMPTNENDILDLVYNVNPERIEAKYSNLIPILTKAIQELHEKIKILTKK